MVIQVVMCVALSIAVVAGADGRFIDNELIIAVYGVDDTFKPCNSFEEMRYCEGPMTSWMSDRGLERSDIFPMASDIELYDALLFPDITDERFLAR